VLNQGYDYFAPPLGYSGPDASISLLLGNGDGTFSVAPSTAITQAFYLGMAVGDFNRDGILDLAASVEVQALAPNLADGLVILLGRGDGTFAPPAVYPVTGGSIAIVADLNGDNIPDLVSGPNYLLGNGDGTFQPSVLFGPYAQIVTDLNPGGQIADLDGHHRPHLVSGPNYLLGHQGTFQPSTLLSGPYAQIATTLNPDGRIADLNGDHRPDFGSRPSYVLGNQGTFQPSTLLSGPYFQIAADLNRDGRIDLAGALPIGVVSFLNISKPPPALTVVSAASLLAGPVSPNSLATAFGKGLALETATAGAGQVPTLLGSTSVSVTDATGATLLAPLLYVSPVQINFAVPEGAGTGTATITVSSTPLQITHAAQIQLVPVAPSMFTLNASGLAAATVLRVSAGNVQTVESVFTEQKWSSDCKSD
jgi:hypothetical protein